MRNFEKKCIVPEKTTGYVFDERIDEQIDERNFYVVGAGQLCEKCFKEIYNGEE